MKIMILVLFFTGIISIKLLKLSKRCNKNIYHVNIHVYPCG